MRLSLSLLLITAWVAVPIARAQTAAAQPAATQPAGASHGAVKAAHPSRRSSSRHPQSRHAPAAAQRSATAGNADSVTLGATDITGNKELPKVMVIIPWKDSLGASGVVKPTDSLLDEVLQPVDRSVFQRRIHYYGQLEAGEKPPAGGKVAPVGDSR